VDWLCQLLMQEAEQGCPSGRAYFEHLANAVVIAVAAQIDPRLPDAGNPEAIPCGVYAMARNEAWVSVGRNHDTPAFAVASIRQWWKSMGRNAYPQAKRLFITADSGGSNGYRSNAWKLELQKFADETKLRVRVSHFPPGTSKWNEIEHRLFCHITQNWRGRPLRTLETLVELIGKTRTEAGLRVRAKLDNRRYHDRGHGDANRDEDACTHPRSIPWRMEL
jgi:Rhodopirellula transposase DDE domain